ncbi:hypothetical protein [Ruminococcus sp.]|uniref:hypothetical protein n=1 Tax=Ruminococcus sp. TaxID=41978 RepID=UPI003520A921
MREFILIVTAVIIIALVAVVFVIMYINHNKKSGKAHKPTVIYYKAKDVEREDKTSETQIND